MPPAQHGMSKKFPEEMNGADINGSDIPRVLENVRRKLTNSLEGHIKKDGFHSTTNGTPLRILSRKWLNPIWGNGLDERIPLPRPK